MENNCRGNNKHKECPQRMADGRNFTDYRPRCISNFADFIPDETMNSYDYRQYLQKNASTILGKIRQDVYNANKCGPCMKPYNVGTMLPEQHEVVCNGSTCKTNFVNPNGLGTGRKYNTSPSHVNNEFLYLKDNESYQYNESCVSTHDDPLFYQYNNRPAADSCEQRAFKPSGGLPVCKEKKQ